jgi:zinc transporter ZupT
MSPHVAQLASIPFKHCELSDDGGSTAETPSRVAFAFVSRFNSAVPYGLGFAAGAMVFIVLAELLPEAYEQTIARSAAVVTSVAMLAMLLVQRAV